jgi:hypothetical protein
MKTFVLALTLLTISIASSAQLKIGDILKSKSSATSSLTEKEAGEGVKEALLQGVTKAVLNLNREDGFFGSEYYKVLLPEDAKKVEKTLRDLGMGSKVDEAILAINRGAEEAAGLAKPIFADAIREMTLQDALSIIRGADDAATRYFQEKTRVRLVEAFTPSVKSSLEKTQATKHYSDIINTYNKLPTTFKKANPDLTSYVVEKSLNALFDQVAKEEKNIRSNPAARATDILKKVFGK